MSEQAGLFDYQERVAYLSSRKPTALDRLMAEVDFEYFRETLDSHLNFQDRKKGGRPPYDSVLMFKVILLQKYYGLSEEETEFQILDRYSFQRFLGLDVGMNVPDKNTIWIFKERLGAKGIMAVFEQFNDVLKECGLLASKGKIVDASFVNVPRQRNSRNENAEIKEGKTPESFTKNPAKERQKDVDARWTTKNKERHYGYKNHIKVNRKNKLIENFEVTDASVHDSQKLKDLIDEKDGELYADSAYRSREIDEKLKELNIRNRIHEKGYRNRPLTEEQKQNNRKKSKIRARVEHVFGFQHNNMKSGWIRTIGFKRAELQIALANLAYNLGRFQQLGYTMK